MKFAKTKPFGSMRIRPGCEELGRHFITQRQFKKADELQCRKVQDSAHGKTTTNFV